jgi:proteic killer suppression protein
MKSARQLTGYRDEKLRGELAGLRSVRLTKAYRVLYFEAPDGVVQIAQVTRVSKHDYTK